MKNATHLFLALAALIVLNAISVPTFADGWVCQTLDNDLTVRVYHHIDGEIGTRTAHVMILSDPRVEYGRRAIAKFSDTNSTLKNNGVAYTAKVDLRYRDSRRKGEYILGTRLGEIDTIALLVHGFSYEKPIPPGASAVGNVYVIMRDGEDPLSVQVDCVRYLKGDDEMIDDGTGL